MAVSFKPSSIFPRVASKCCWRSGNLCASLPFQYQVTLFVSPGFTDNSNGIPRKHTFLCEVEIATAFAPGPIPRTKVHASPILQVEHPTDYGTAVGLLTVLGIGESTSTIMGRKRERDQL